jgi:hypothetical protein
MGEADKLFTDGEAYERLMGRWSRIVGHVFLDWLDAPKNLRWLDVGCGNGAFTQLPWSEPDGQPTESSQLASFSRGGYTP